MKSLVVSSFVSSVTAFRVNAMARSFLPESASLAPGRRESRVSHHSGHQCLVDAIGIDHVGIGTDTDIVSSRAGQSTDGVWAGLSGGFIKATVAEMRRRGRDSRPPRSARSAAGTSAGSIGKVTKDQAEAR